MGWVSVGESVPEKSGRGRHIQAGYTLIEILVGATLMAGVLGSAILFSRNSGSANVLGRDLAGSSALLASFVEEARTLDFSSVQKNREYIEETEGSTITWIVYDHYSSAPYKQPAGLLLFNAKLEWTRFGKPHQIETSTMLTQE